MTTLRSICVYCGSSDGTDPAMRAAAEALGRAMGAAGIRLVYGGGDHGLMGTVARATLAAGGTVLGIIPGFLRGKERMVGGEAPDGGMELVVVEDMHTRKRMMFEQADAFVALPGGIGTLEELVEQMTWAQLGRHAKPVVIADVAGFWAPLLDLIAHMRRQGFIRAGADVRYHVVGAVDDVVPTIRDAIDRAARTGAAGAALDLPM